MKKLKLLLLLIIPFIACKKVSKDVQQPNLVESMYFPSNTDNNWEAKTLSSLGWNASAVQALKDYLIQKNTKSFMILV
ncbi:MAG: hypothetical protein Q7U83_07735, partial [Daejeonella sp.]|nr:hypothetical protein [Daejeonella sp.]